MKKRLGLVVIALVIIASIVGIVSAASPIDFTISYTYNGENQPLEYDDNGYDVVFSDTLNGEYSTTVPTFKDAGDDYTVYYMWKTHEESEYDESNKMSVGITVNPKPITLKGKSGLEFTYGDDIELDYRFYEGTSLVEGDTLEGIICYSHDGYNAGKHRIMIKEQDEALNPNYAITFKNDAYFMVNPLPVNGYDIIVDPDPATYKQGGVEPAITVEYDGDEISEDEYSYSFENNTSVGTTAKVTVTDVAGNYEVSTWSTTFTIVEQEVTANDDNIELEEAYAGNTHVYTGYAQEPGITIYDNDGKEIPDSEYDLSYTGNLNAGTATITITDAEGGNYIVNGSTTFEITPIIQEVNIAIDGETSYEFTGEEITPSVIVTAGSTTYDEDSYIVTYEENIEVGTATIKVKSTNSTNVENTIFSGDVSFDITKKDVTLTPSNNSKVYGEDDPTLEYEEAGVVDNFPLVDVEISRESGEDVGNYTISVTADAESNKNYNIDATATATFTITQKDLSIVAHETTKVYGSGDPEFNYEVTGLEFDDTLESIGIAITRAPGEDVGEYAFDFSVDTLKAKNYNLTDLTAEEKFKITQKPITVKIADDEKTFGDADPVAFEFEDYSDQLAWEDTGLVGLSDPERESGENAGTYAITAIHDDNEDKNYAVTIEDGVFTINPKTVTATIEVASGDYTYCSAEIEPEITVYDPDTNEVISGDEYTIAYSNNVNAGEATITLSDVEGGNYVVSGSTTFTIEARTLTVTLENTSKTYGEPDPEFEYEADGIQGNDTLEEIGIIIGRESGENARDYDYTIAISSTSDKGSNYNYTVLSETAKFTILPKAITIVPNDNEKEYRSEDPELEYVQPIEGVVGSDSVGTVILSREEGEDVGTYVISVTVENPNTNYEISGDTAIFTINPKVVNPANVEVESGDYIYNKEEYTPAVVVTDPDGDVVISGDEYSVSYDNNINAGLATVTITDVEGGNYIVSGTGSFEIKRRELSVKAQNAEKIYGDEDPVLQGSGDNLVSGDTLESIGVTLSRESGENVGTYDISITSDTDLNGNYHVSLTGGAIFTINPRPITIKPNDLEKVFKEADPELTYVDPIENIVSGDTINNIVLERESGENVGTYEITVVSFDEDPNYIISGDTGVFTITPRDEADPEIVHDIESGDIIYDGTEQEPAIVVKDADGDEIPSGEYKVEYSNNVNAGEATITIKDAKTESGDTGNYNITETSTTFQISRRDLTLTVAEMRKIYGDEDPELTCDIDGLVSGDTLESIGVSLQREEGEDVGEYPISITYVDGSNINYNVTITGAANLVIEPKEVFVTADDASKVYGEEDPDPLTTYSAEGLVSGDTLEGIYFSRDEGEDAGEYPLYVNDNFENTNYVCVFTSGVFTIERKDMSDPGITVELDKAEYKYTGKEITPKVKVVNASGDVIPESEYTIEYVNNKEAGTGKVIVKDNGTGNLIIPDVVVEFPIKKSTSGGGSAGGASASSSYKITTKGENGTITPENPTVKQYADQEFTIKAKVGYEIKDVLVDGKSVGAVQSYKFERVKASHTIEVKTERKPGSSWSNASGWAKTDLERAEELGLIPESLVGKDFSKELTRKEFAAIVVNFYEVVMQKDVVTSEIKNPFTDCSDEYVLKAYKLGITLGTSETTFTPDLLIPREQLATMILRTVKLLGADVENVDINAIAKFDDDGLIHEYAKLAVYYLTGHDIIKGVGDNKFDPAAHTTIEQALVMILRCNDTWNTKK